MKYIQATKHKPLKPIQFVKVIESGRRLDHPYQTTNITESTLLTPADWHSVVLISKGIKFDIMHATDDKKNIDAVYLGHWNAGVISN